VSVDIEIESENAG